MDASLLETLVIHFVYGGMAYLHLNRGVTGCFVPVKRLLSPAYDSRGPASSIFSSQCSKSPSGSREGAQSVLLRIIYQSFFVELADKWARRRGNFNFSSRASPFFDSIVDTHTVVYETGG